MTTEQQEESKLTAAKATFLLIATAAFGWAGVLVAAVAVGTERALGGDGSADRARRRAARAQGYRAARRQAAQEAREYLHREREAEQELTRRRREYFAGGEVGPKPERPHPARRAGAALRRLGRRADIANDRILDGMSKVAGAGREFAAGFRETYEAAKPHVDEGFKATARTREQMRRPAADPVTPAPGTVDPAAPAPEPDRPHAEQPGPVREPAAADVAAEQQQPSDPTTPAGPTEQPAAPAGQDEPNEGDPSMTIPQTADQAAANTTNNAPMEGDTEYAALAGIFESIKHEAEQAKDLTDQLAQVQRNIEVAVGQAADRAGETASTETVQALDAASALARNLGGFAGNANEAAAHVVDNLEAADRGLDVGRQADDSLTQAGATGELVGKARE